MQLDLFLDGREALFVNDLVAKLLERSPAGAEDALDRLREESPEHPDLGAFDRLVQSLRAGPPAPPGAEQLGPMIESLAALVPAAERLLGRGATAFLLRWWQALARTEAVPAPGEPAPRLRYWIGCARWNLGVEASTRSRGPFSCPHSTSHGTPLTPIEDTDHGPSTPLSFRSVG